MRFAHLGAVAVLAISLNTALAFAQKEKRHDVSGFSFVTGPKRDRPQLPGLNAVLLLTEEQKEKLVLAHQETLGSDSVLASGRKVKTDPNATEADRQAARRAHDEAQTAYDRKVAEILTPAQKELVQRLQVLYSQSREAVSAEYAPMLVSAKGNEAETVRLRREAQAALTSDFGRRVNEILTPEQRTAFERSAADEKQREAAAKTKSKN